MLAAAYAASTQQGRLLLLNWILNVCYGSHLWRQLLPVIVLRFMAAIATTNFEKGLGTLSPLIVKTV